MGVRGAIVAAGIGAFAVACISRSPRGEALVVVDTDVPVPTYASRLRLDVYSADGSTWTESRETPLRTPSDWPASFSLYTDDESAEHVALIRIRIFQEGVVRDYRGERFTSRAPTSTPSAPAIPAAPSCDVASDCELPRLVRGGVDLTPTSEPHPYLAIDRLVRVRLVPGVRGRLRLVLHGACFGTMADMASLATCIDEDAQLVPVATAELDADMTIPVAIAKSFGAPQPCPESAKPRTAHSSGGTKLYDEEVCSPGGTFVFGNRVNADPGPGTGVPERVATVPPFTMDKYEVTVARWRDAVARGFKPSETPTANPLALSRDTCANVPAYSQAWCTYSTTPRVPEDRETYPLSCVSWKAAREFCQFEGGDLPTEAQWEWVAQAVGRSHKTDWPWGDEAPDCGDDAKLKDRMIFKRLWECSGSWYHVGGCIRTSGKVCTAGNGQLVGCGAPPVLNPRQGPQPEGAADYAGGDVSASLGIVNLAGGLQEYTVDSLLALSTQCWASAPMLSPVCIDPVATQHTLRGDAWEGVGYNAMARRPLDSNARESNLPEVGFRCVRRLEAQ